MNSTPVPASKLLTSFIRDAISPVLVNEGFKATGRVFRRTRGDALQVVDIQNWKNNDSKRARFTIEVGVCFPRLLEVVAGLDSYRFYREMIAKPGITACAVRRRIGEFLEPSQDRWWTISATTGHVPDPDEVSHPLASAAIPWMESMSKLAALANDRAKQHALDNKVMHIAALFALGEKAAAEEKAKVFASANHGDRPDLAKKWLDEILALNMLAPSRGEA